MKTKLARFIKKREKIFTEKGADLEHKRWARWQNYIMTKLFRIASRSEKRITLTVPIKYWKKWKREIKSPYAELSEEEKESDRKQTRAYLPVIRKEKIIFVKKIIETVGKLKKENERKKHIREESSEKYRQGYEAAISDIEQGLQKTAEELK